MKRLAGSLKLQLAVYREVASFAQFDTDIDEETKAIIGRGKLLTELLKQGANQPLPTDQQLIILYAGLFGSVEDISLNNVAAYENRLLEYVQLLKFDALHPYLEALEYLDDFDPENNPLEIFIDSYESTFDFENPNFDWEAFASTSLNVYLTKYPHNPSFHPEFLSDVEDSWKEIEI